MNDDASNTSDVSLDWDKYLEREGNLQAQRQMRQTDHEGLHAADEWDAWQQSEAERQKQTPHATPKQWEEMMRIAS